jgi:cell division protein FtsQ
MTDTRASARSGVPPVRRPTVSRLDVKRRGRRRGRLLAASLAALALIGVVTWTVLASPLLAASRVEVVGIHQLTATQVIDAAHVPLGRPMALLDLARIVDHVDSMPWVASVVVSRSYPHTVRIAIVERRPAAVAQNGDGPGWRLLDASGFAIEVVSNQPAGLPVVDLAVPGANPRVVRACVAVAAALPPSLRSQVQSIYAASVFGVTLHLAHGVSVLWGDSSDSTFKAQVLAALMKHRARSYDVSVPTQPTLSVG